jgi:hypothetical protein
MSGLRIFATLLGCSLAALGAPINPYDTFTELRSRSSQTVNNPLSVTVNLFSTQIIALGPGGLVVFDQTLQLAFTDATVQALVAQATLALNGIGASSILGPSLTSSCVVSEGSSVVTSVTGRRENEYLVGTGTIITIGPDVVTIGEMECQSFAITGTILVGGSVVEVGVPSGCTGGTPYAVGEDENNFNTWTHTLTTIFRDVTTTETLRTRQVYVLQAQGGESAVPEPETLGMLLAGAPVLLWAVRQKSRAMRNH